MFLRTTIMTCTLTLSSKYQWPNPPLPTPSRKSKTTSGYRSLESTAAHHPSNIFTLIPFFDIETKTSASVHLSNQITCQTINNTSSSLTSFLFEPLKTVKHDQSELEHLLFQLAAINSFEQVIVSIS